MATGIRVPLRDYASKNARGLACWICSIPERKEIDEALKSEGPVSSISLICRWLMDECKYSPKEASRNKLRRHRDQGHHEQG